MSEIDFGLTPEEYLEVLAEIEKEDKKRLDKYNPNDTTYGDWRESILCRSNVITEYKAKYTHKRAFMTDEKIGKCLALAIIEQSINDFLLYHPQSPFMKKLAEQSFADPKFSYRYNYRTLTFNEAQLFLFEDNDSYASGLLENTGYEVSLMRRNALSRLDQLIKHNWVLPKKSEALNA